MNEFTRNALVLIVVFFVVGIVSFSTISRSDIKTTLLLTLPAVLIIAIPLLWVSFKLICSNCGKEFKAVSSDSYCGYCAAQMGIAIQGVCPECGAECDTTFCGDCGTKTDVED